MPSQTYPEVCFRTLLDPSQANQGDRKMSHHREASLWDSRVLHRLCSVWPMFPCRNNGLMDVLGSRNEDYPENIEMPSMKMAGPLGHALPGDPRNGYGKHVLK